MPVLNTADALYVGSDAVEAVYLGLDQVYASGPLIRLTGRTVAETAATGTTVGTLSVINATGTPTFTLTDSAGGKFAITGTTLKTNAALDYETATFHTITVHVTGMTPTVGDRTFIVLVTDVVEPVIVLTGTSIAESASIGAVVGTLSVANAYTGTPVFTLPGSSGGKFAVSGSNLTVASALDYETATSHSITVAVSGITPVAANGSFTVTVTDVLELDPVIQLTGTTVNEDAAVNTTVGTLSVTGTYTGTPVYALTDSAGGKFNISGTSLRVNATLDYETAATHSVTVAVSGITPAAANKVFTVVVLDITEAAGTTWNPSDKSASINLDGTSLIATRNSTNNGAFKSVRAIQSYSSGKKYWEYTLHGDAAPGMLLGVGDGGAWLESGTGQVANTIGYFSNDGVVYVAGSGASTQVALNNADVMSIALDMDNGKMWFRRNAGNWNNSGTANPTTNTGGIDVSSAVGPFYPAASMLNQGTTLGDHTITANFGASTFAQSVPSGFTAWGGGGSTTVTKNIVTHYGAVGDGQWAQATLSISTNVLTSATAIWPSATSGSEYIGKSIMVGEAGGPGPQGGQPLLTTITGWTVGGTQITLGASAGQVLSSAPNIIVAWGTDNGGQYNPSTGLGVDGPFATFRNEFQGLAVTLTIPAGTYFLSSGNFASLFNGIKNITVNATGATVCGGTFGLNVYSQHLDAGFSAETLSVSAGASSVTLETPSQVSMFTVGRYVLMTGFQLQYGGWPTNHQRFEYLFVTAIDSDSGSPTYGKITFLTNLVNSYLSTWPQYLGESGGSVSGGGPATLYAMYPHFDHTAVINNLRIAHHAQWAVTGLHLTLNDCVFDGLYGPYPTLSKTVIMNNCTGTLCHMEVDKQNTYFEMNGCTWGGIGFQSASTTEVILDNTDVAFSVSGSPRKLTIRNGSTVGTLSTIGVLSPGPGYGYSNELIVSNSTVEEFGAASTHESGSLIPGKNGTGNGVNVDYTMSGGVITVPIPNPLAYTEIYTTLWPVTDGKVFLRDSVDGFTIGSFRITDVTQSGGNALVTTTLSGGWPSRSGHKLSFILHPAPVCTFTNVHGCPEVEDLSNATAAGLPLYSYSKRTYTGLLGVSEYWQVWGRVKKIVVIVTTPSAAAASVSIDLQASNFLVKMSDYSNTTWQPIIDLSRTGTRTFDATAGTYPVSSWSNTATLHADVLPGMTEALWVPLNYRVNTSGTAAAAVFSVEVITDQGF